MGKLDGRVAIVTGAGRGQGRAHALALAREGAKVVVSDIGEDIDTVQYPLATGGELDETVRLIEGASGEAMAVTADMRSSADVDRLVRAALDAFGTVDVLVANAGICAASAVEEITDQQWSDMIETNLGGPFRCIRAVLPAMKAQRFGRIVVTASMTGRHGNPNLSHYTASKFGVIGLVKTVALEVAQQGITVNAMCPTSVDTPMLHNDANYRLFCPEIDGPTVDDVRPRFASLNPMGVPWIAPEVFTDAVMYLVCDSGYVTGTTLEVGAGISAQIP